MELSFEDKFNIEVDELEVEKAINRFKDIAQSRKSDIEVLKKCFSMIDLTTLNATDGYERGKLFADKVSQFPDQFPGMPNVAAICVYPSLVSAVKENLSAPNVSIASVAAGFPASQTFLEIKLSECEMALEHGANELDVVISVGSFLEGDYYTVFSELQQIKEVAGDAKVKVILETGALTSLDEIKLASFLAMEAGADFIKTSTGKLEPAATPEAVYVMCTAIKEYYDKTGKKVGMKPAGGVSNSYDAALFYTIAEQVLGQEWLYPGLFRFGTSRLADVLLSDIIGKEVKYFSTSSTAKY
ncbi:MAG: deoxyribose-phosphate aldolase [Tenuifilum sp.]|jgi:deoxyribose-phosphate aldolase|uniref:deoxyribose-phosphate aldolase n=1 Tax=Tenuifilum sp. TaxID=2760880 RepID=UPI0024ABD0BE|nr:deoxyribose-phosphate aldolase [Tenuifilum sp.]MDI3526675.1 deoxyribose-phosphate aldolase [Tenuifilum sp.]